MRTYTSEEERMKIAIDLDDTAWKYQDLFVGITTGLKETGHTVGILTAHSTRLRKNDLKLWKDRGFPNPDFYIAKLDPSEPIGPWKARMMKRHKIDVLFDDFGENNPAIERDFFENCDPDKVILKVF